MRTDRFLDQVSLDNFHNAGAFARAFGRVDLQLTARDLLRLQGMGGRSHFQLANLRSQQRAGQDQRETLADAAAWGIALTDDGNDRDGGIDRRVSGDVRRLEWQRR
jgi:hypothetical protein